MAVVAGRDVGVWWRSFGAEGGVQLPPVIQWWRRHDEPGRHTLSAACVDTFVHLFSADRRLRLERYSAGVWDLVGMK